MPAFLRIGLTPERCAEQIGDGADLSWRDPAAAEQTSPAAVGAAAHVETIYREGGKTRSLSAPLIQTHRTHRRPCGARKTRDRTASSRLFLLDRQANKARPTGRRTLSRERIYISCRRSPHDVRASECCLRALVRCVASLASLGPSGRSPPADARCGGRSPGRRLFRKWLLSRK